MIEIKRYTPQEKQDWNDFVANPGKARFFLTETIWIIIRTDFMTIP